VSVETPARLDEWLAYLRQRNRSPETIRTYRSNLLTWAAYPSDLLTATVDDADAWWADQEHLAVRTRARSLSCVRSFYTWAMRFDLVSSDPTRRLDAPALPKGTPRYITRDQLDVLLRELPGDLRRAVCLGAWAGLRVSEVAALTWADIDREAGRIHVRHGKGNRSRAVGAHPVLLDSLMPDTGGNVVTGGGETYTPGALQRRVNRAIKSAGVDATFHQLRHRFGTITYGRTGDPIAVAAAMGHSSLETTRIYAAVSDDALDRVAAAAVQ
jgi:site-specific recombinase XerD